MATYVNGNLAYREGDIFGAVKGKEIVLGSKLGLLKFLLELIEDSIKFY